MERRGARRAGRLRATFCPHGGWRRTGWSVSRELEGVRHAVRDDLTALEASLTDAFAEDPMMAWIYPDPGARQRLLPGFMRIILDVGVAHGHAYTVCANVGGAVWGAPDVDLLDDVAVARLFGLLGEQLGPRAAEVGAGLISIGEHHPHDQPHFYLLLLGTARSYQSKGAGSALVGEVLDRCDRQGFGAYLESSNRRNVPFYERHGFRAITEIRISESFTATPMWRDPQ
jgi:GNAT superfamily N-acetyltransferase